MTIDRSGCKAERHGTYSAYAWWRCRCPDAREAWRVTRKRAREGRTVPAFVDITGTARRLQGLVALGYDWEHLGRRLGRCSTTVYRFATCAANRIRRETAGEVAALFEELSATPAPDGFAAKKARDTARRNGYMPPLAWGDDIDDPSALPDLGDSDDCSIVDEVAVAEVAAGRLPFTSLRPAEKVTLFRDHLIGVGLNDVMTLLHMSATSVARWRAKACPASNQAAA